MTHLPSLNSLDVVESDHFSPKLVAMDSNDKRSRPFNLLRVQVTKKLDQVDGKLIGITSAAPGAGKSFVASNLAASLGMLSNRQTYLIDLDLRRASVAHVFGIEGNVASCSSAVSMTASIRRPMRAAQSCRQARSEA
mgnify:CR=1 FL=1